MPLDNDVDLDALVSSTPGMAGADLASLATEAALLAARRNHNKGLPGGFDERLQRGPNPRPRIEPVPVRAPSQLSQTELTIEQRAGQRTPLAFDAHNRMPSHRFRVPQRRDADARRSQHTAFSRTTSTSPADRQRGEASPSHRSDVKGAALAIRPVGRRSTTVERVREEGVTSSARAWRPAPRRRVLLNLGSRRDQHSAAGSRVGDRAEVWAGLNARIEPDWVVATRCPVAA